MHTKPKNTQCCVEESFLILLLIIKVNKSVYIAKSEQPYDKTLNNFLLHVSNNALKDMYILNYVL